MRDADKLILVVEDDPVLQMVIVKQLSRLGFVGHVADNGALAVLMAQKISYVLILMDIQMPKMDGITATQQIRKNEQRAGRRTPIVALTATTDRATCLQAGMDDFLHKPITLDQLKRAVEKYVSPVAPTTRLS